MMTIHLRAIPVMCFYGLALYVILRVSPRLSSALRMQSQVPWWRNVKYWAAFVAITQIVVYALFS
jgi:hypothetical protein